ncbi:MAG: M56 family metallopeptidase [Elainellaceae cyanobacterium]
MHLSLILGAIALASLIRLGWSPSEQPWTIRWQTTLVAFLLPPLVIITTVIAVICMGTQGEMIGMPVGWVGYSLALGLIGIIAGTLIYRGWHGWRSLQQVRTYPVARVQNRVGHILDTPALFAAEIGFWTPELVISRGLLDTLDADHLNAVLTHEHAHEQFRDTFWFFWLGWIKQLTQWLPRTDALWHELLLLRELRADAWAARSVDPLLLAESLLLVVRSPLDTRPISIAFDAATPMNRLEIRIEALLGGQMLQANAPSLTELWWAIALLPLLTMLLHS